jgi:acetyl-CoA carboxylase biotin carboxylase subunit
MAEAAARIGRRVKYTGAGTIEFLVDRDESFYFLEMNTRLQVEHAVTEAVTGVDLVRWQIRIAQGECLDLDPEQTITPRGHAIECRIYAEDADQGFLPSPGLVREVVVPGGPFVRDDRGVESGTEIPLFYDPLIAKLTVWGASRDEAISRLGRALDEYRVAGVRTTLPFFRWLIRQPAFVQAQFSTSYLDELLESRTEPFQPLNPIDARDAAVAMALDAWFGRAGASRTRSSSRNEWADAGRREGLR